MTHEVDSPPSCPRCGGRLVGIGGQDRLLTCGCGFTFDTHLSKEVASDALACLPITWKGIADALDVTIKEDYAPKVITFAAFVLAKTESDQVNIGFQAESSSGKTYIPLEVAGYFPPDDVNVIAGASPTAFFHEYGEWDAERKVSVVNMEGKVLVFLDSPDYRLVEKLRPLLSHDKKILTFKITDKSEKRGLRTKTVEIIGFPVVVFCSTKLNPDEQEKTRLLLISPGVGQEKLEASLRLVASKAADSAAYKRLVDSDPRRKWLKNLAHRSWNRGVTRVKIASDLYTRFAEQEPRHKPRHQRDLPRIASLIKAHAILNADQRELDEDGALLATAEDVEEGFALYGEVSLSNELGISPYVMGVYKDVIEPLLKADGLSRKDVYRNHYRTYGRMASQQWYEKEIFPTLVDAGLVMEEPDPADRRRKLLYPPDSTTINSGSQNNNSGVRGVASGPISSPERVQGQKCEVCGKTGGEPHVSTRGVSYLHPECEKEWPGEL